MKDDEPSVLGKLLEERSALQERLRLLAAVPDEGDQANDRRGDLQAQLKQVERLIADQEHASGSNNGDEER